MIDRFGTENIYISAKYTPFSEYKTGCVRKSLEKDHADFHREYVDIYLEECKQAKKLLEDVGICCGNSAPFHTCR